MMRRNDRQKSFRITFTMGIKMYHFDRGQSLQNHPDKDGKKLLNFISAEIID